MKDLFGDQDYNLWVLLLHTRDTSYRARYKELQQHGITPEQVGILFAVKAIGDEATNAEISRWLLRQPHTISHVLSRMERQGLVKRFKDLGRKNLVRISLTEKGQQIFYQTSERESIHRIMSSLSEEQHQQLRSCLEIIRDRALNELGIHHKIRFPPSQ